MTTFGYDDLDRLTSASTAGGYSQEWQYDPLGNITQRTGTGAATYAYGDPAHKHAVTSVGSQTYGYDANGNMTARAGDALSYDAENHLTQVVTGGGVTSGYTYNGDGARVKKTANGVATYYVGNYFEVTGSTVTKYYYPSAGSGHALARSASR